MPHIESKRLTVSVIVPTYNRADLLAQAIESVLAQTRPPEEILVIDDGSTDNTQQVLRTYAPRVRAVTQANQGVSAARNHGMRLATGDVFIFLDSDDLLTPRCVELCAGALERHPEAVVVYSDCHLIDGQGNHLGLYSQAERGERSSGMIFDQLAQRCIVTMSSGTVRRAYLDGCEFDTSLGPAADYDFWSQLAARRPFIYVDEPTCCYRYHGAQMIAEQRQDILAEAIEVQRRIMAMPEFGRLSRRAQAAALCTHGVKHSLRGDTGKARWYFACAAGKAPWNPVGPALLLLSLLGDRALRLAIDTRRRFRGNYIDGQAVGKGKLAPLAVALSTSEPLPTDPTLAPTK